MFNNKLDFVCFSRDIWGKRLSRKHLLMSFLAENDNVGKVVYIEPAMNLVRLFMFPFSELGDKEGRTRWKRALLFRLVKLDEKLFLFTPLFFIPLHRFPVIYNLNRFVSLFFVRAKTKKLGLRNIILWLYHPWDFFILKWFKNRIISCFDWALDWTAYHTELSDRQRERMRKLELSVVKNVDIVFAISEKLLNIAQGYNPNSFLLPSGANPNFLGKINDRDTVIPNDVKDVRKPIIGYVGTIAETVDFDLLDYVTDRLLDCSFVFIGLINPEYDVSSLNRKANVHFLGLKDYRELPSYLKAFDVCIIPYNKGEVTESADSTKLYEYLASGNPVVSTPTAGVERFRNCIKIANTKEEFADFVEECLEGENPEQAQMRIRIAEENSWTVRAEHTVKTISQYLSEIEKCEGAELRRA